MHLTASQGGGSLLHLASFLGHGACAVAILEQEDQDVVARARAEAGAGEAQARASAEAEASAEAAPPAAPPLGPRRERRSLEGRDRLGRAALHLACTSAPHFRSPALVAALLAR